MKKLLIGLAAALLSSCTNVRSHPPVEKVVELHMTFVDRDTQPNIFANHSAVVDFDRHGVCSGSFVDSTGDILTARHCVQSADEIEIVTSDGKKYATKVLAVSPNHDLALIHADIVGTPHFDLAERVNRGETIYVLGSPLALTNTLTTGMVAKLDGDETLLDCGVLPGNSGSAVFDEDGKLVGVATAGYIVGFGTTHLNLAQGRDVIAYFIAETAEKLNERR